MTTMTIPLIMAVTSATTTLRIQPMACIQAEMQTPSEGNSKRAVSARNGHKLNPVESKERSGHVRRTGRRPPTPVTRKKPRAPPRTKIPTVAPILNTITPTTQMPTIPLNLARVGTPTQAGGCTTEEPAPPHSISTTITAITPNRIPPETNPRRKIRNLARPLGDTPIGGDTEPG